MCMHIMCMLHNLKALACGVYTCMWFVSSSYQMIYNVSELILIGNVHALLKKWENGKTIISKLVCKHRRAMKHTIVTARCG